MFEARGRWTLCGVLAVIALEALRRAGRLAPPSLFWDDQYVMLLARDVPLSFSAAAHPPSPIGFLGLQSLVAALGGGAGAHQSIALLASLAAVGLLAWLVWRLFDSVPLALLAAVLLGGGAMLATMSLRIKHYALEALLTTAVLVAVDRATRGETVTLAPIAGAGLLALPCSLMPNVLASFGLCAAFAVGWRQHGRAIWRQAGWGLGYLAVGLSYALLFVSDTRTETVAGWYDRWFMPGDPSLWWSYLWSMGGAALARALPDGLGWLALLVPIGVIELRHRGRGALAATVLLTGAAWLLLSALRCYPLGAGRLDVWSFPATVLLVVAAIAGVGRARHGVPWAMLVIALAVHGHQVATAWAPGYPPSDEREFVEALNKELRDDDELVVWQWDTVPLALYGRWPFEPVRFRQAATHFYAGLQRPRTHVLLEYYDGAKAHERKASVTGQVDAMPLGEGRRVVLAICYAPNNVGAWASWALLGRGYRHVAVKKIGDARIVVWER